MAEYIEREAALSKPEILTIHTKEFGKIDVVPVEYIANLSAADVAPVVHRKAIYRNRPEHYFSCKLSGITEGGDPLYKREHHILENNPVGYCSECGKRLCSRFTNYCPSCGAKMEEARHS